MADENSTVSDLSIAITTEEDNQMQSTFDAPSLDNSALHFTRAVIAIGVMGTAANALILYALIASKQHKKQLLIVNQNVLDLFGSFFLIVTYSVKLWDPYLSGALGYWLCMMILTENVAWWGINGSILNLAAIAIDRYLKVVHHIWSKKWLRTKVIHSAIAFVWMATIVHNNTMTFTASAVIDGVCDATAQYKTTAHLIAAMVSLIVICYVLTLLVCTFCYWRILTTVRRQARVMASHSHGRAPNTIQIQSDRMKSNVIKTMITVSAFYAISWLPCNLYFLNLMLNPNDTFLDGRYYASMFIGFFYICSNPFIYATKFEPVKKILKDMISCKKIPDQPTDDGNPTG